MSSADADDPPRSRLFVVCPKGTGQDTLQRAFEDLLAKLSTDPPFAAGGETTPRKDPDEDARNEHHDDGLEEDDVDDEPRDEPPLVKHLESVRVVPRKGVAFVKFSDAATAMRCMAAIADANGALGALRVKCMLAEPKASAGAGAGAAERANGTPPPPPQPSGGAAAGGGGAAREGGGGGGGGGVAAGSRPRGERSGEAPGGSASPKRARRGGDGDGDGAPHSRAPEFPPPPNQTPVLGSETRRQNHRTSRTSPASSAESGGGIGRGIERSRVQNPVASPPMPPGPPPPPGVFLGEAWMGDGRRGALVFHPRMCPAAAAPPPPPPHYPPPAFAHFPAGTPPHPHTVHAHHHAHVGVHPRPNATHQPPPDWPPPSPVVSGSGASSALSGGGGGVVVHGGGVHGAGGGGGAGACTPPTTSADSDSVRSNGGVGGGGAAGHTRRAFVVLDKTVTQSRLESLFRETCEGVVAVELKTDGESGRSRGFAYVTFDAPARVRAACERLNGRELPEGSGVRCKVMPALDRERSGSNKRRSNGRAGGGGTGNGRGGAGSAAAGASSGEGADRSTRTDALAPSPSPESDAKKKTRMIEEDDDDDDALSWQLPGPRKYSRLNSPSAGDVVPGARSFDPDDDGAIGEEEEGEDDDDEAESGPESASSRRLVLRREASRSKAEEEATDAAMALGKVSLGVVPEEDTAAASAGDRTRREGATDAEPSDGKSPDDTLDKFEVDGELAAGGDDGPGGNRTRDLSDRDDDEPADGDAAGETAERKPARRPDESESDPVISARVLFFRLALPLPSYALRHVLASHGEVADLSMRPDGASGRVEYADEEGADAALEALHATEILGIELRVSRLQADVVGKKAAAEGGGADQRKKRTRRA